MPIYEYECNSCGKIIEHMQKLSDPNPQKCSCGGRLNKLISNSSFHLKGTGWYVTDYKGKKGETSKKSSSKPPAETKTPANQDISTSSSKETPAACKP